MCYSVSTLVKGPDPIAPKAYAFILGAQK